MYLDPFVKTLHLKQQESSDGKVVPLYGKHGTLILQIEDLGDGEVVFQGAVGSDLSFRNLKGVNMTSNEESDTANSDGIYLINVAGMHKFRAKLQNKTDSEKCTVVGCFYGQI